MASKKPVLRNESSNFKKPTKLVRRRKRMDQGKKEDRYSQAYAEVKAGISRKKVASKYGLSSSTLQE